MACRTKALLSVVGTLAVLGLLGAVAFKTGVVTIDTSVSSSDTTRAKSAAHTQQRHAPDKLDGKGDLPPELAYLRAHKKKDKTVEDAHEEQASQKHESHAGASHTPKKPNSTKAHNGTKTRNVTESLNRSVALKVSRASMGVNATNATLGRNATKAKMGNETGDHSTKNASLNGSTSLGNETGNNSEANNATNETNVTSHHEHLTCKGGPLAVCQCIFNCKIFGGRPSQCSGSKVKLLDNLVKTALNSSETACEGMQCIVRCSKTLGCFDEQVQHDCKSLKNQTESLQNHSLSLPQKHDTCRFECDADDVDENLKEKDNKTHISVHSV